MRAFWTVVRAVSYRNIRNMLSRPFSSLIPMIIPLVFFASFAGGFGALSQGPQFDDYFSLNYVTFQFVFVWLQGSAFQGMFSGFIIARDFEMGFARRLMLAAPNRVGIIGGYLASTLTRCVVAGVITFAAGLLAGMQVEGNVGDLIALVLTGLLVSTITSLWAAGVALRFRRVEAGPLMQMPIFVIIFLSPVFVPIALMTGWIREAARVNPFRIFIEQGRNFIAGTNPKAALVFGVALLAATLMTAWSVRGLRSAERAG